MGLHMPQSRKTNCDSSNAKVAGCSRCIWSISLMTGLLILITSAVAGKTDAMSGEPPLAIEHILNRHVTEQLKFAGILNTNFAQEPDILENIATQIDTHYSEHYLLQNNKKGTLIVGIITVITVAIVLIFWILHLRRSLHCAIWNCRKQKILTSMSLRTNPGDPSSSDPSCS